MSNEEQTKKVSYTQTVNDLVVEKLEQNNITVIDQVVNKLATIQIVKRADALTSVIEKVSKLRKDLYKIKAQPTGYNEDGSVASVVWKKEDLDERKKILEQIEKLENAITKAVEKNDWVKLLESV